MLNQLPEHSIIIVDDDDMVNASLKMALDKLGYHGITCANADEFETALETYDADVVLMDVHLGDVTGIDLLERIRKRGVMIPVVMITGYGDIRMAVRAMKAGAEDFILKPITIEQLEVCVQKALRVKGLTQEVQRLKDQLNDAAAPFFIAGASGAIKSALALADTFAQSDDTTVLLQGESGTGKELFAHYLHNHSNRASQPMITVDCTSIPRELAENELFGYERGAYTGATEKLKKGKFELANGGTIFLDEISDLPFTLQSKLLRVIESKRFYRLGGTHETTVDVRVIAATNKNLASAVAEGSFREDLFYRLNVASIMIPPLRERNGDILIIAKTYMDFFNLKFRKNVHEIAEEAAEALQVYPWKGNVRELRNAIERAMLVGSGDTILFEHLVLAYPNVSINSDASEIQNPVYNLKIPPTGMKLNDVMKDLILQTLKLANGNQIQAAKILGITRGKFRYRMEQLGIELPSEISTLFN